MKTKKDLSKAERQQKILEYLIKNGGKCSRRELSGHFNISINTLCTDLQDIRSQGIRLEMPARSGQIILSDKTPALTDHDLQTFEPITHKHIRKWYIIQILSLAPRSLTLNEIAHKMISQIYAEDVEIENAAFHDSKNTQETFKKYEESYGIKQLDFSIYTLRNDLKQLKEQGYLEMKIKNTAGKTSYRYSLTRQAPLVLKTNAKQLENFRSKLITKGSGNVLKRHLENVYEKACILTKASVISAFSGNNYYTRGKSNFISEEIRKKMDAFLRLPYQKYYLDIPYTTHSGEKIVCRFATGLIVYSQEKNHFYIFGESDGKNMIFRLSQIDCQNIKQTEQKNNIYNTEKYRKIFDEMFSISMDDRIQVTVRFQDFGNIKLKIEELKKARAATQPVVDTETNPGEIIYRDTIRGLEDFARYLRLYGRSAIAVEPPQLVDRMKNTPQKIIDAYERIWSKK